MEKQDETRSGRSEDGNGDGNGNVSDGVEAGLGWGASARVDPR